MTSQDDLTLLKQMYQRGEIGDKEYDVLRRHVLWGTPLPQLVDEPAAPPPPPDRTVYRSDYPTAPPPPPPPPERTVYRSDYPTPPPPERTVHRSSYPTAPPPPATAGPAFPLSAPAGERQAPSGHRHRADEHASTAAPPPAPAPPTALPPDAPPKRRTRKRRGPRLLAGLTSLVLALALVAAGVWWFALREIGVDAPAYARSVCSSVRDWQQAVDSSGSALVRSIAQQDDRRAVRTSVATHYTNLAGRTDALRGAVLAAGIVDVPGGQAYADSLAAAVGEQSAALRDLAARAGRLEVGSEALFQISLQSLLTGAETAVSDVTAALARPEAGTPAELRLALSDEPACAPYVG